MTKFKLSFTEEEFRAFKALSYSKIATYSKEGAISLITKKDIGNKPYIIFGKLTDDMLLSEQNLYKYKINNYNGELPTGNILNILNSCVDLIKEKSIELTDEIILEFFKKDDFYSSWKDATKIKKIRDYSDYITYVLSVKDSILITPFMWGNAEKIVNTIKTYPTTSKYFNLLEGQEGFNQVNIITEYNGSLVKGAFDRLVVDHVNKTLQIIDLKTGSAKSDEFIKQFYDFKYWIQATLYTRMLENIITNDPEYSDYSVLDFIFIYMPSSTASIPTVLTIDYNRIEAFENGFYIGKSEFKHKGLKELIKEVEWHYESQVFDVNYDFINKDGCYKIDENQIKGDAD